MFCLFHREGLNILNLKMSKLKYDTLLFIVTGEPFCGSIVWEGCDGCDGCDGSNGCVSEWVLELTHGCNNLIRSSLFLLL